MTRRTGNRPPVQQIYTSSYYSQIVCPVLGLLTMFSQNKIQQIDNELTGLFTPPLVKIFTALGGRSEMFNVWLPVQLTWIFKQTENLSQCIHVHKNDLIQISTIYDCKRYSCANNEIKHWNIEIKHVMSPEKKNVAHSARSIKKLKNDKVPFLRMQKPEKLPIPCLVLLIPPPLVGQP